MQQNVKEAEISPKSVSTVASDEGRKEVSCKELKRIRV